MWPDNRGYFGYFGGRYVPEVLIPALEELSEFYFYIKESPAFIKELALLSEQWAGRPTPLYRAARLAELVGIEGTLYLKREDLLHTGAHKINNAMGQALLARKMGKRRIVAETGAGQHGVAVAAACAVLDLDCIIYMGEEDMQRQAPNVSRIKLLGASIKAVQYGSRTLKEAVNEAFRHWVADVKNTHYLLGSAVGPHPFPVMVRDFQAVIGREVKEQILCEAGRLPDEIVACVGGGSNAIGIFYPFIPDEAVGLVGVEAGGIGMENGNHAASINAGKVGIFHGSRSNILQDNYGFIQSTHSISAGLDYPGVGPEHSHLNSTGRARYVTVEDEEALDAARFLSRTEGIIPALESAHALAYVLHGGFHKEREALPRKGLHSNETERIIVVNLSGRGDKDMGIIGEREGEG